MSYTRASSSTSTLSTTQSFRPYYSPTELSSLISLQSSAHSSRSTAPLLDSQGQLKRLSSATIEQWRQLACSYIERVGARLGFPRRTIATAQQLYHRFHLHFQLKDFPYHDVSLSALLVASKLEDTLKKLREIQIAGWQVLNLLEGGTGVGEGDLAAQEAHRPNLIAIERLLLQTICFNFNLHRSLTPSSSSTSSLSASLAAALSAASGSGSPSGSSPQGRDIFTYVLRISRLLFPTSFNPAEPSPPTAPPPAEIKSFTYLAHLLAIDLQRTIMPLAYPPHTCAVACVYLASFLWKGCREWEGWQIGGEEGEGWELMEGWVEECETRVEDVQEICHSLLDLLILLCPALPTTSNTSTNLSGPSPSFAGPSPLSLASPSEGGPLPSTSSSTNSSVREREKHLLQTGVPASLSLGWGGWLGGGAVGGKGVAEGGGGGLGVRSIEDLTRVKIRLRELASEAESSRPPSSNSSKKRPSHALDFEEGEDYDPKRARAFAEASRWAGGVEGMREVEKLTREREERDAEREREREAGLEGMVGGEEGEMGRVARGEKKPSSVRYRF